jgi:hypothetical protein
MIYRSEICAARGKTLGSRVADIELGTGVTETYMPQLYRRPSSYTPFIWPVPGLLRPALVLFSEYRLLVVI